MFTEIPLKVPVFFLIITVDETPDTLIGSRHIRYLRKPIRIIGAIRQDELLQNGTPRTHDTTVSEPNEQPVPPLITCASIIGKEDNATTAFCAFPQRTRNLVE